MSLLPGPLSRATSDVLRHVMSPMLDPESVAQLARTNTDMRRLTQSHLADRDRAASLLTFSRIGEEVTRRQRAEVNTQPDRPRYANMANVSAANTAYATVSTWPVARIILLFSVQAKDLWRPEYNPPQELDTDLPGETPFTHGFFDNLWFDSLVSTIPAGAGLWDNLPLLLSFARDERRLTCILLRGGSDYVRFIVADPSFETALAHGVLPHQVLGMDVAPDAFRSDTLRAKQCSFLRFMSIRLLSDAVVVEMLSRLSMYRSSSDVPDLRFLDAYYERHPDEDQASDEAAATVLQRRSASASTALMVEAWREIETEVPAIRQAALQKHPPVVPQKPVASSSSSGASHWEGIRRAPHNARNANPN